MTASRLDQLREYADDPVYANSPPGIFVEFMGLRGCNQEFLYAAWRMFKEKKDPISLAEIQKRLDEEREINRQGLV